MITAIRTDSRRYTRCTNRPTEPDIPSSGNRPMKRHMLLLVLTLLFFPSVRGAELHPGRIRGEQTIEAGAVPAPIRNDLLPYSPTLVPYTFQWEYAEEANLGLGWLIIFGATSESYQPGALGKSTRYRRAVVYMDGIVQKRAYTNEVLVTVTPATQPLTPGSISGDQTVDAGVRPAELANVVSPQNPGGTYTVFWQSAPTSSGPWTYIAGATALAYRPQPLAATTYFRRGANRADGQNAYSNVVCVRVVQPLSDANYVLEYEPLTATDDPRTLDAGQCRRTATYADGLGRPVQTVRIGASPSGADLVTRTDYDSAGRESRSWLPVPVPNNGGKYVAPATLAARAESFYADEAPYGQTVYEASPLHRTASAFGPGKAWHESGRAVRSRYLVNSLADSLRCARYVADSDRDAVRLSRQGDYPEGELFVTATTDEDGRLSYTFYDKGGQSVLSRQMNGSEALDTYYVYDACGLLRAVLPPKASAMLESQTGALDISSVAVADQAYLYRYDRRGRPVGIERPESQEVRYLYDDTDRPVFWQDGVQRRSGEWSYSIPDAMGREVLRGTCKTLGGANLSQSLLDGKTLVARYDGVGTRQGYTVLLGDSAVSLAGGQFLVFNYYDNYDFLSGSEPIQRLMLSYDVSREAEGYGKRYTEGAKGLHTGRIIGSLNLPTDMAPQLGSAYYYDLRGRLVQSRARNHLGGLSTGSFSYDFVGNPLRTLESHASSSTGGSKTLSTTLTYDHDGRLTDRQTTLSSGTVPLTVKYAYDEAGRLSRKMLGPIPVSYSYNVRGWLRKLTSAPFSSELRYEQPQSGGVPLYSGMVSQWTWKQGQQPGNDYKFSYDGIGRLIDAVHSENGARTDGYTERGIRYDANGNLLSISRTAGGALTDSLIFSLTGNKLTALSGTSSATFEYDANGNLAKDGLNGLEFSYNCLNLMQTAQTASGALKAQFTHSPDGEKLSARVGANGFEYLSSLIYTYRGGTLSLAQAVTDEGTIQLAGVNYFIRDHLGSVRAVVDHTGKIVERNDYYPFGGRHENASLPLTGVNRYKFGGKETLEPVNLDMLDFGARFYDPRIARWNTQDPLAEKYFSLSPYNYCAGNPVTVTDPDGRALLSLQNRSPIYDRQGKFLGTDDEGLQGEAIVMDSEDFRQGMSPDEARSKRVDVNSMDQESRDRMTEHYNGLKDRPDYDGYLTLQEANEWYRNGNGEPLFASLEKIDLSGIYSLGEKYVGQEKTFNLFNVSASFNDRLVYGTIKLKRYPNHQVRAYSDIYDFDMHNVWNPLNWPRNILTVIGGKIAGQGQSYEINLYGSKTLKPLLPWVK